MGDTTSARSAGTKRKALPALHQPRREEPMAYNNLAWMTVERKAMAARHRVGQESCRTVPRSSPFYDTLGWAQRAAGELASAQSSLKRAIELESNVAIYHYHLAFCNAISKTRRGAAKPTARPRTRPEAPRGGRSPQLLKELPSS